MSWPSMCNGRISASYTRSSLFQSCGEGDKEIIIPGDKVVRT